MKTDSELIWESYIGESKFGRAIATGALAASTLLGGVNAPTMSAATAHYNQEQTQVLDTETVIQIWSKKYQGTSDPEKEKNARELMKSFDRDKVPQEAKDAIHVAVYIFGGDMGVTPNELEDLLYITGWIESLRYTTKRQFGTPVARGYWQVEPKTAISTFTHSRALFGRKWREIFGGERTRRLLSLKDTKADREWIAEELERDVKLAAAMAAAKWITAASKELKEIREKN